MTDIKKTEVLFSDAGNIIDGLTGKVLKDTPEESVRQQFIMNLPQIILQQEIDR